MTFDRKLEIACFNFESARIAELNGADRIELCENYPAGGLTPSFELIRKVREFCRIPLHVIIRPHPHHFAYSSEDICTMEEAILFCKKQKVDGVVFGMLDKTGKTIDLKLCERLLNQARPLNVTFHRAIDLCEDIPLGVESLIQLGIDRVLTAGGEGQASDHATRLEDLQRDYGHKICIMPGGGIRSFNLTRLLKTGCNEFHTAALQANSDVPEATEIIQLKQLLTGLP